MKTVAIIGASGLIGRALTARLDSQGFRVVALTRSPGSSLFSPGVEVRRFDPNETAPNPSAFEGTDVVVNLAGETVASRWNAQKKQRIYDSRVHGTRNTLSSIAALSQKPRTIVSASATGYYGDCGSDVVTEDSAAGMDFLARVCADWESEARAATKLGMRSTQLRTGIVLARNGGALGKMLPPFRLCVGGPFGSGKQFMPWIHIDDLTAMYRFAIESDAARGAYNAVAATAITNAEFANALGRALHRPAVLPAPAFALRAMLGEFAESLLASQRIVPKNATDLGFTWQFGEIDAALENLFD